MTDTWGILTDITLCTGCEECVKACKVENGLGCDVPRRWKRRIDDLSSTRHTTIVRQPRDRFVRQFCRHCLHPACASACIVGALRKTPEGPVVYDRDRCMGCRYCLMACPFGIPKYEWESPVPYVRKCTMCHHRIVKGRVPACVEACPEKATIFGTRSGLLAQAKNLIQREPRRYLPRVFGEKEVGGTCVLYASGIPLDFLQFRPEVKETPLPELTWAALTKVPPIVVGMTGLMAGVWWIIGRRMQLAREAAREARSASAGASPAGEKDEEKTA
ncbi:MAG: 4Fe-4S dicluster domain-containing protein [Candidatus Riflebacteria bacterium]|nr:4Fe-4S dicluster domain-containing protein [Candidatus Riflebacteria bacterium]